MRTTGTVKWFDPVKGDGCVVSDGCTQAALDRATLAAAGILTIAPGTPLTYEVELAEGRLTVTEIYEIDGISPAEAAKRRARTRGKIKWFDPVKGIVLTGDAQGDVLLHRSILQQWGSTVVGKDGAVARDVVEKIRGLQTRLVALDKEGLITRRPREIVVEPSGPWAEATCKWFSRPKGYGFVRAVGGGEDIFIQMDTLRRANIPVITAGERVQVRASRTDRGLMATEIAIASARAPRAAAPARRPRQTRTAGERKTGVIGHLLSVDEEKGFGLVDLPELDAVAIADIALLRAAGLLDEAARTCRLICDIEYAPPLIHIRCLTRLH